MPPPHSDSDITFFAETTFRGERRRFGIRRGDRRQHMYILGRTGMGKSTLLETLIASDLAAGNGLALLDPHGDLARRVLALIPEARRSDLIDFNPAVRPLGFNPLQRQADPGRRYLVATNLLAVFRKVWGEFWGPRMEHIFRYALLALLEAQNSTLLDLPRLLTDEGFRRATIAQVNDPAARTFWATEFATYGKNFRGEAVAPVLNKVGSLLASPVIRAVLGEKKSAFSFRDVMDRGRIFVATLSKGSLGEDAASLLGALLITGFHLAALRRADTPEDQRRDFYLYVDEVHSFATLSLADILHEARKYRLNLVLAHQYLGQLDERLQQAVLGTVGSLVVFRLGTHDARIFADEFFPAFSVGDLVSLPRYHVYLRLPIDGIVSRGFSATTLSPRRGDVHDQN